MEKRLMPNNQLNKILDGLDISSDLLVKGELNWGNSFQQVSKYIGKRPKGLKKEKYQYGSQIELQYIYQMMDQELGIIFNISTNNKIGLYEIEIKGVSHNLLIKDEIIKKIRNILPNSEISNNIISDNNIDIIIHSNITGYFNIVIIPDMKNRFYHGDIVVDEFDGNLFEDNKIVIEPMEYRLLELIRELVIIQQEAINAFAKTTGILAWDYWMCGTAKYDPRTKWIDGESLNKEWKWTFHGFECDFYHNQTGNVIRIDFGDNHRTDNFTDYGIGRYKPKPPWKTFKDLEDYLLKEPFDPFICDSTDRLYELIRKLRTKKLIMYSSIRKNYHISPLGWKTLLNSDDINYM